MQQPELGKFISKLRKQKGLSQEELSVKCKINIRSIQRIEAGTVKPHLSTLKTLSSVLETDFLKSPLKPKVNHLVLSKRDNHFLKRFIQKTSAENWPPSFTFIYSAVIILTGLILITFAVIFTVNNLNNDKVVLFIFLPGLLGGVIVLLLGQWVFTQTGKQQSNKKLAGFIKKFILLKDRGES